MQGPKKNKTGGAAGQSIAEHAARGAIQDPRSARMVRMGQALGNDELQRRLDQGRATRDELLTYLSQRLGAMREAQLREEQFGKEDMRSAWKEIADHHKSDITKPEPTRWHEAARLYEEAASQLCRGALDRGAQILERAMSAEERAFERVGDQIGVKDLSPGEDAPAALDQVKPGQGCPPADVPFDIEANAHAIQANTTTFKDQPVKRRIADPWWTLEEEEEEEEGGEAG
jgi:hypothetical protein